MNDWPSVAEFAPPLSSLGPSAPEDIKSTNITFANVGASDSSSGPTSKSPSTPIKNVRKKADGTSLQ